MNEHLQLVPCDDDDPEAVVRVTDAATEADSQARDAIDAIRRPADEYLHLPWPALDEIVGGVPPGDLWYVGGFSGDGKTTMLTSLTLDGISRGWRVYYLGLESRPQVIRTHFACKALGYDAGDLLSGAYLDWPNHAEVFEQVRMEVKRQSRGEAASALRVSQARKLDAHVVREEFLRAAAHGARVVIVDHVDHLADTGNAKVTSDAVQGAILDMTQQLGLITLAASQLNNDTIRGDRSARYRAPAENCWKYGSKKRDVASGMLAIYRPLRIAGVEKSEMAKLRDGEIKGRDVCEPNTMAVMAIKHRLYGGREGMRALLGVYRGRVTEWHGMSHLLASRGPRV